MTAPAVLAKKVKRVPQVAPTFRALVVYAMDAENHGAKLTSSEHPEPTIIVLGAYSDKASGAVAESEAIVALNRGRGNDTMHVVISLESGRSLTDAEWKTAADIALDNLNMRNHIAILGVHRNTENEHGHLVINRVCPEPDDRGRYMIRTDGGSVCSKGKDGRMRTNEVLSLHRAAAEIAIGKGWPLSENGRFGPDLQLRGKADKLRLSSGSATATALGKDSPEFRTALAAQAALAKARETSTGADFWAKARCELADAGIDWKVTEHVRKGKIVYGGKLTGEDGTNVKQSRLEDAYQIKALVAEFGPPPAEHAPAKISKEEAVALAVPVLADSKDWPTIHSGLAEHGLSLERKGQGAVIRFNGGKDELKLSDVGREHTFGKLEKRLGAFEENANAAETQIPTAKPARLPKGVARVELPEARAAALYREARATTHPTAYLALRGLTPTQIVQVGKTGEKLEGERRERAEARPTPTARPIIRDHVLPRNLSQALDEVMAEMEQLSRSNAAMRRIREAIANAEAAEAKARQLLDEAKKQEKALETRQQTEITRETKDNDMFDFLKKKTTPEASKAHGENDIETFIYQPKEQVFVGPDGFEIDLAGAIDDFHIDRLIRERDGSPADDKHGNLSLVHLAYVNDDDDEPSPILQFSINVSDLGDVGAKIRELNERDEEADRQFDAEMAAYEAELAAYEADQLTANDPLDMDDPLDDDVPLDMDDDDLDGPRM